VPSGANLVRLLIMNPPLQWDFGILHRLPQVVVKLDVAVPRDMSPSIHLCVVGNIRVSDQGGEPSFLECVCE